MIFSDTSSITQEQVEHVEDIVNELIRMGKKVTVTLFTKDFPEEDFKMVIKSAIC